MAKKTMIIPDGLNKAVNQFRKDHPKPDGDLQTYTWAVIELLNKALAEWGIEVEEEA